MEVVNINKYEFYNLFIQFLYPILVLNVDRDNKKDEEKKQDDSCISLYNSNRFTLCDEEQQADRMKQLLTDLHDQGAEYRNKLIIMVENNNVDNNELINRFCDKLSKMDKAMKHFYIFDSDKKDAELFTTQFRILTEDWYNAYKMNNKDSFGYPSIPSIITDHLFLSGVICAENLFILQSLDIKLIINCTKDCKNHFQDKNIIYHRIGIDDNENEDITLHLQDCYKLLDQYIDTQHQNVLIHCQQGKSRSVSFVIYYLMMKHKWNVQNSLKYIQHLRQSASPNKGFLRELNRLYQTINP